MNKTDMIKTISNWQAQLEGNHELHVFLGKGSAGSDISEFCDMLAISAPSVHIKYESSNKEDRPYISVNRNFKFYGVPEAQLLPDFLGMISGSSIASVDSGIADIAKGILLPTHLHLFIGSGCPHCPGVFRQIAPLSSVNNNITISVYDAMSNPEISDQHQVKSVPTIILEPDLRWTGAVSVAEVVNMMAGQDPQQIGAESLINWVSDGRAEDITDLIIKHGLIFSSFYQLLSHEKWPVRLGAMVVMESLIERAPDIAMTSIPVLWDMFDQADDAVKGDTLYLFGEMGGDDVETLIHVVLQQPISESVRDAASDALGTIRGNKC